MRDIMPDGQTIFDAGYRAARILTYGTHQDAPGLTLAQVAELVAQGAAALAEDIAAGAARPESGR